MGTDMRRTVIEGLKDRIRELEQELEDAKRDYQNALVVATEFREECHKIEQEVERLCSALDRIIGLKFAEGGSVLAASIAEQALKQEKE
jgi:hypothetical protein